MEELTSMAESQYASTDKCCQTSTQQPRKHKGWHSKPNLMDRPEAVAYHSSLSVEYSRSDGDVHQALMSDRCPNQRDVT
jgi:hypothetical protein